MPGSTVTTACCGRGKSDVGASLRRLVHLEAQAVPERVPEGVTESARGYDVTGQRIALAGRHARPKMLDRAALGGLHQLDTPYAGGHRRGRPLPRCG